VRRRIVEALIALPGPQADDALVEISSHEENAAVREEAALAAARRGRGPQVARQLAAELQHGGSPAALNAFAAVADEAGLPPDVGPYPSLLVSATLAQRRWRRCRVAIISQTLWAAVGGAAGAGLVGSLSPLFVAIAFPEGFQENLAFVRISAWAFTGALAGMILGAVQGGLFAFLIGLADGLSGARRSLWRLAAGAVAGLVFALYTVTFAAMGLLEPEVAAGRYVPAAVVYSLLWGAAMTVIVPRPGARPPVRRQLARLAGLAVLLIVLEWLYVVLVYPATIWYTLTVNVLTDLALALGIALALSEWNKRLKEIGGM
jgi:hypothetical protein